MTSILKTDYQEPNRPYSQNELQYMRDNNFRMLRIGKTRADHKRCRHVYYVKENGRKESEILKTNNPNIGNCSVCWKLSKTEKNLKNSALDLTDVYIDIFGGKDPKILTHKNVDVEIVFYKWLYEK